MDGATDARGLRSEFTGRSGDFFALIRRGVLLEIVSFGVYRFWLIADVRRHIWAHTRLGGVSFQYVGRPGELLIGTSLATAAAAALVALAVMVDVQAESARLPVGIALLVALWPLVHYGSYRAYRYRANRTAYRGVRFRMDGSGWHYAGRAVAWDILTLATLGLAWPWRAAALERYKMRNTRYGALPLSFGGAGPALFRRTGWLWFVGAAALAGWLALARWYAPMSETTVAGGLLAAALIGLVVLPLCRTARIRWWLQGIELGPLAIESLLRGRRIVACYAKAALALAVYLTAALALAASAYDAADLGRIMPDLAQGRPPPGPIIALLAVLLLAITVGAQLIRLQYLVRGIWAATARSTIVFNLAALDRLAPTTARPRVPPSAG